ncbi:hypothetical protein ASPNIDRAFT_211476 [Aspergillus niger ATCC 1015]|uniref:Zn(2)-C6 fungal-type domain-containing protein n=1 Tax=Aspergillus niger (strain ATCC 1015 / CBS 113.46 / FGSC A1144 / LSHB Ac4 / NCTC 3858a / NRRL 328 / USDA 3528.7) TaxID=380704 RepID=G3XW70_ASPNA|nr:hypothetical protein ASPNIDRAFT_211476 [Aspergillus niger ATCC 1015]
MENINIPSPSAILDIQRPSTSTDGLSNPSVSPKNSSAIQRGAAKDRSKPKQTKSRNGTRHEQRQGHRRSISRSALTSYCSPYPGCKTCKDKRLKCDETKPSCIQCRKRNVTCEGYIKKFQWRNGYWQKNLNGGTNGSANTKKGTPTAPAHRSFQGLDADISVAIQYQSNENSSSETSGSSIPQHQSRASKSQQAASSLPSLGSGSFMGLADLTSKDALPSKHTNRHSFSDKDSFDEDILASSFTDISPSDQISWISDASLVAVEQKSETEREPKRDLGRKNSYAQDGFSFEELMEIDDEDIEEIVRRPDRSMKSGRPENADMNVAPHHGLFNICREPNLGVASPEMLVLQFDRVTCGILSVKDGIHENPWRTLIWPLAKETPALYHAVFSLAAFHSSKEVPALRVHGVDHMRQSITHLVHDIRNMRVDAALATSLALAFADTWDQHTRTCIQHLKGAKALVSQVVGLGAQGEMRGINLSRVRFLYNTWLYMDVIARLTSREESGDQEVDAPFFQPPSHAVHEIDPLMGCATTLFPLINQVARLVQRVRKTASNSISLISQAIELKRLVEQWEPPQFFEPPEDPSSEVQHSIQTAHAYRWATLLYLHQAVPEMPSEPTSELAKRVLILLATVPSSSRTLIIQMFPLLAAGSEAEQEDDRQWVLSRWESIQTRLMLGSIDRCIEIVREVWARRDAFEDEKQRLRGSSGRGANSVMETLTNDRVPLTSLKSNDQMVRSTYAKEPWRRTIQEEWLASKATIGHSRRSSAMSPLENIEFEKTVRGRLHWINVMQDWGWEGTFELLLVVSLEFCFAIRTCGEHQLIHIVFLG